MRRSWVIRFGLLSGVFLGLNGCAASKKSVQVSAGGGSSSTGANESVYLCGVTQKPAGQVVVSSSPGSDGPNVRRVYRVFGVGEDARQVMVCREVDTNFDGRSDVVRFYSENGESLREAADSNYSGTIDTWLEFSDGSVTKISRDTTGNGSADEIRYYVRGVLRRVERDTTGNTRPNVWEIYRDGRLERVGTDLDGDGRVDRWDRDKLALKAAEEAERAKTDANDAEASGPKGAPTANP